MTFKTFVISKRPLWVDGKLHLTVDEMFELVEEWEKQGKFSPNERCVIHSYDMNAVCIVCGYPANLYLTQDNNKP